MKRSYPYQSQAPPANGSAPSAAAPLGYGYGQGYYGTTPASGAAPPLPPGPPPPAAPSYPYSTGAQSYTPTPAGYPPAPGYNPASASTSYYPQTAGQPAPPTPQQPASHPQYPGYGYGSQTSSYPPYPSQPPAGQAAPAPYVPSSYGSATAAPTGYPYPPSAAAQPYSRPPFPNAPSQPPHPPPHQSPNQGPPFKRARYDSSASQPPPALPPLNSAPPMHNRGGGSFRGRGRGRGGEGRGGYHRSGSPPTRYQPSGQTVSGNTSFSGSGNDVNSTPINPNRFGGTANTGTVPGSAQSVNATPSFNMGSYTPSDGGYGSDHGGGGRGNGRGRGFRRGRNDRNYAGNGNGGGGDYDQHGGRLPAFAARGTSGGVSLGVGGNGDNRPQHHHNNYNDDGRNNRGGFGGRDGARGRGRGGSSSRGRGGGSSDYHNNPNGRGGRGSRRGRGGANFDGDFYGRRKGNFKNWDREDGFHSGQGAQGKGKDREVKRTLTDFRISSLTISEIEWGWVAEKEENQEKQDEVEKEIENGQTGVPKTDDKGKKHRRDEDDDELVITDMQSAKKVKSQEGAPVNVTAAYQSQEETKKSKKDKVDFHDKTRGRENSRLRIYFASPVSAGGGFIHRKRSVTKLRDEIHENDASVDGEPLETHVEENEVTVTTTDVTTTITAPGDPITTETLPVPTATDKNEEVVNGNVALIGNSALGDTEAGESGADPLKIINLEDDDEDAQGDNDDEFQVMEDESFMVGQDSYIDSQSKDEHDGTDFYPDGDGDGDTITEEHPPEPAPDRISVSYARNTRRIVLDAEIVEKVRIIRSDGRIEITVRLEPAVYKDSNDATVDDGFRVFKGILVEALDELSDDYMVIDRSFLKAACGDLPGGVEQDETSKDGLLPPLHRLYALSEEENGAASVGDSPQFKVNTITIIALIDKENPLTEARWVKSGDVEGWINQMMAGSKENDPRETFWRNKIEVVDPDPPPTIQHALDTWLGSSTLSTHENRANFVNGHMKNIDNVMEILLRLVRTDRATQPPPHHNQPPTLSVWAANINAPCPELQTYVSLAVFQLFRLAVDSCVKHGGERSEVETKVSEMIRNLPYHLVFKSLDSMFKDWLITSR